MPYSNRELFARLLECEAGGEGDNGQRAVASVVMNRVQVPYGEYFRVGQGDIRKIINQRGQFDCIRTELRGAPNAQNIYNMNPTELNYEIADWAINGGLASDVLNSLWYMNPFKPDCPTYFPYNGTGVVYNRLRKHCFYTPTNKYAET